MRELPERSESVSVRDSDVERCCANFSALSKNLLTVRVVDALRWSDFEAALLAHVPNRFADSSEVSLLDELLGTLDDRLGQLHGAGHVHRISSGLS